jgi:hypothetical protein
MPSSRSLLARLSKPLAVLGTLASLALSAGALANGTAASSTKATAQALPATETATKPKKRIHPCDTPDPGFFNYEKWDRKISRGQVLIPKTGGLTKDGGFDVIVHFHGHEAVRKEFTPVGNGIVLVGIDEGVGSRVYSDHFLQEKDFMLLLKTVAKRVAEHHGVPRAYVRHLALSSWSAGYGAIREILQQPVGKYVDSVLLLDSLYASFDPPVNKKITEGPLEPFLGFAKQAAAGKRFMFHSHSQVLTPNYANSREVSEWLIGQLGGKIVPAEGDGPLSLKLVEKFDKGKYHSRGFAGRDKPAHCGHLGLLGWLVAGPLKARWNLKKGS